MTRLFINVCLSVGDEYEITGEDARYLSGVLRMRTGEQLTIVNQNRDEYLCEVIGFDKKSVTVSVVNRNINASEPPFKAVLYQSVSKGERMDYTIQKSVELGVSEIVPVFSERCVVRQENGKSSKLERWQKIAEEAARQSGRGIVPVISEPLSFDTAIKRAGDGDVTLFAWEEEKDKSLKQLLHEFHARLGEQNELPIINIFIGPEGGYSSEEAVKAENEGFTPVTLGPRILRTESAAPCVLSMLIYEFEL
ncbi:MAG: 16S rRNA (uracil(1498)-N(3))-methyltransferase [Clostridia bacterium]|nr:16S rRNA (uracil(1498)-N(3))-methyltransferase [Clostridia bacterium]